VRFLKNLLLSMTVLAFSAGTRSEIIQPETGDGEFMVVLYSGVHKNSLVIDLGITLSAFNIAVDQSFDLTSSPFYATFLKEAKNDVRFVVVGGDSLGPIARAGAKQLFVTTTGGGQFPAPTNFDLSQFTSRLNLYQQTLNRTSSWADFQSEHRATANGSSLDKISGRGTSFDVLNLGILSQLGANMVEAGNPAELFAIKSVDGDPQSKALVLDFYSDIETSDHHGAYFSLDVAEGRLNYFGTPKIPSRAKTAAPG
jgi:hypothetical protein